MDDKLARYRSRMKNQKQSRNQSKVKEKEQFEKGESVRKVIEGHRDILQREREG